MSSLESVPRSAKVMGRQRKEEQRAGLAGRVLCREESRASVWGAVETGFPGCQNEVVTCHLLRGQDKFPATEFQKLPLNIKIRPLFFI